MAARAAPAALDRAYLESSPFERAGLLSRWSFSYILPLLRLGSQRPLERGDLPELADADTARHSTECLWKELEREAAGDRPPAWKVLRSIYRARKPSILASGALTALEGATIVLQPLLIGPIVRFVNGSGPARDGYLLACALAALSLVQGVTHHINFFLTMRLGWQARIGMTGVLHRKLLRVNAKALERESSSSVFNLISSDCDRFDQLAPFLHFGWVSLFEIAFLLSMLVLRVGWWATAACFIVTLLLMKLQSRLGKLIGRRRRHTAGVSDRRTRLISEIVDAMLTVKTYCWERAFVGKVTDLRGEEHASIRRSQAFKGANLGLHAAAQSVLSLIAFGIFVSAQGETLSVENAYSTIALIAALREVVGRHFARFIESAPEVYVACGRMGAFLEMPESEGFASAAPVDGVDGGSAAALSARAATYYWEAPGGDGDKAPVAVRGATFEASAGQLVAVAGAVGAGKSALLQGLLGELHLARDGGAARIRAEAVAYSPQAPWIITGDVLSNIVFNAEFEMERFLRVLHACDLVKDVRDLPDGIFTEIGEKGVNLSGGQKARISMARAAYSSAPVVFLDDPLAAVDPAVAGVLFHACIRDLLVREQGRTVLLVTHQEQFFRHADKVLRVGDGGRVLACEEPAPAEDAARRPAPPPFDAARALEDPAFANVRLERAAREGSEKPVESAERVVRLVEKEDRAFGKVSSGTVLGYLRSGGLALSGVVVLLFLLGQASMMLSDYWLKEWAEADDQRAFRFLGVFLALTLATVALSFAKSILFFRVTLKCSSVIHNNAFHSVIRAPLHFFDATPKGRILNRFSSDIAQADELLAASIYEVLNIGTNAVGAVLLGCVVVPWLLLLMPLLLLAFVRIRNFSVRSMRELKRMDQVHKSPVFSGFTSALQGLVPIRAYRYGAQADAAFVQRLEEGARPWFFWLVCNRWVGFWLDIMVTVIVTALAFLVVALRESLDPALAGFALVYIIGLSGVFQYMVRQSALVESYLTSVERLLFYATGIPQEPVDAAAPGAGGAKVRSADGSAFPSGALALEDLSVRYRGDLPLVLSGVSLSVPAGTRLGVVGRTGSGKSSLLLSIARLNEVCGGAVRIGGVDAGALDLADLRRSIAVIPQESHLFTGTLRFNLDPFDDFTDAQMWEALRTVQLHEWAARAAAAAPEERKAQDGADAGAGADADAEALRAGAAPRGGLDYAVEEGGANLSGGQRQLINLARALMRRRRLVLMDEATAAVDFETDRVIQAAIRESPNFAGATIVTIAHRLQTVLASDLILVLDQGRVAELGPPAELAARGGIFAGMMAESEAQREAPGAP